MPEIQEITLQAPTMANDHFHIEKSGDEYQCWTQTFTGGESVSFWLDEQQQWITGTVDSWYIPDGSGNAPAANAHYFLKWETPAGPWKYDLHAGLKVRVEAPTDEELIARSGWCEGADWINGYNEPSTTQSCSQRGKKYVAPSGQKCWYCDQHRPSWAKLAE